VHCFAHCQWPDMCMVCTHTCVLMAINLRRAVCRPLSLSDAAFGFHALTFLLYSKVSPCAVHVNIDIIGMAA
jgi:hypothetical protein